MQIRKIIAHGVEWVYSPAVSCVAQYRGFDITIRRVFARTAITGKPWRLYVSKNNGGSLAFSHQFWPTVKAAQLEGMRLVESASRR